jgi:hypothetical protein
MIEEALSIDLQRNFVLAVFVRHPVGEASQPG